MKSLSSIVLILLIAMMSCESNSKRQKKENADFAPKLTISEISKGIPDKYEIYRLIPLNFDIDPNVEYLAIIRPDPDISSVLEPLGDVYVSLFDYNGGWVKSDSFNLGKPFIKEEFRVTDIDSNSINEIHLEGWSMYANGETESEVFVITRQGGKIQNACEYIEEYYDLIFDRDTGEINVIDWLKGDDLDGDGIPDDIGYWNCHYFKCVKYKLMNGRYVPVQEMKSKRKYTFDTRYGKCKSYSIELMKKEFGLRQ